MVMKKRISSYGMKSKRIFILLLAISISAVFFGCSVEQANLKDGTYMNRIPFDNAALRGETSGEPGHLLENPIMKTADENVSTFSIDVDTASYVNFRRYISQFSLAEFQQNNYSIRTEEAINYFRYDYVKPDGSHPVAVGTLVGDCPWNKNAKLAVITLAARDIDKEARKGSNIVFLIDVSGSMDSDDKLPLVKETIAMAVKNLNENDTVSIVTYASGVKTVLSGAKCSEKEKIQNAIDNLEAGGSTAGADGLNTAYSLAADYFIKDGNNRIILATDGDFNVGPSSIEEMKQLVTERRESGIFITVLGYGITYNSGDKKLEVIADNGNGGFYVIDSLAEGEKVLDEQFSGSFYTVAKDVKVQVEFNKETVESYRLIGYENRVLDNADFENDKKDAGDMGAGQTVTAMYEITVKDNAAENLFSVKVRFKEPDENESKLYEHQASVSTELNGDFHFAAAVAEACLVINNSEYKADASLEHAYNTAKEYCGDDVFKKQFVEILAKIKG